MPRPWTHLVSLLWPPALSFYERRVTLLRELEEKDLLQSFQVSDQRVAARLDLGQAIEVGPTGATLVVVGPDQDDESVRAALAAALTTIDPAVVRTKRIRFQFLQALKEDYDEARRTGVGGLVGPMPPEVRLADYALTLDGAITDPAAEFHVETGIVNRDEVAERLAGTVGRMGASDGLGLLPEGVFVLDEPPAVAHFTDWVWLPDAAFGREARLTGVLQLWDQLLAQSERLLPALRASGLRVDGGDITGGGLTA